MDFFRTLMVENNVVSTTVYTLNYVQVRKVLIQHLLNYGMDTHPMQNILRYLEASVIFSKNLGMAS